MSRPAAPSRPRTALTTGLASSRGRFQRRASAGRRRAWKLAAYAGGVLTLLLILVWVVYFTSVFSVRSVEVDGVPTGERSVIERLAAVPMGTPLARVDASGVIARVGSRPTVSEVSVQRSWPSTLVIHATPRTPALVVRNPKGELQVVDAQGIAYTTVPVPPKGVPVATAASSAGLSKEALQAALSVVEVLPSAQRARVSDVTVSGADLVTFSLGRTRVVWGGAQQPDRKLQILQALMRTSPKVIDVSAPETPVSRG